MRRTLIVRFALSLTIIVVCLTTPMLSLAAPEVKVEDIISGYLASLGDAQARAAAKSRVVEGTTQFNVLTGGSGKATDGSATIVSEGRKLQLMLRFSASNYRGERFICDGSKVSVAPATDAKTRSNFGHFVYIQDILLREGLLGGELTTAWPLFELDERKPKLTYNGLKTVQGRQLHEVQYKPKKGQDVQIRLYFEPESYHHVLTLYTLTIQPQLVGSGGASGLAVAEIGGPLSQGESRDAAQSRQSQARYSVEERFGDFKTVDGLTLPNRYTIHFTQEPQGGNTTVLDWNTQVSRILQNVTLDPRNFQVK